MNFLEKLGLVFLLMLIVCGSSIIYSIIQHEYLTEADDDKRDKRKD